MPDQDNIVLLKFNLVKLKKVVGKFFYNFHSHLDILPYLLTRWK